MNFFIPEYPSRDKTPEIVWPVGWNINWDWTIEDMDFVTGEIAAGVSVEDIADTFEVESRVIEALCERNGIAVPGGAA